MYRYGANTNRTPQLQHSSSYTEPSLNILYNSNNNSNDSARNSRGTTQRHSFDNADKYLSADQRRDVYDSGDSDLLERLKDGDRAHKNGDLMSEAALHQKIINSFQKRTDANSRDAFNRNAAILSNGDAIIAHPTKTFDDVFLINNETGEYKPKNTHYPGNLVKTDNPNCASCQPHSGNSNAQTYNPPSVHSTTNFGNSFYGGMGGSGVNMIEATARASQNYWNNFDLRNGL
jgi:hypothetical protein